MTHAPTLLRRIARRTSSLLDRPCSWLEIRETSLRPATPLTYAERVAWRELRSILSRDSNNRIVFDIGAGCGVYALMFLKTLRAPTVYAFEPHPGSFATLKQSVRSFPRVTCFNLALGEKNHRSIFHQSSFADASSLLPMQRVCKAMFPHARDSTELAVPVVTLDEFAAENGIPVPDLVKIDVQGYEDRVLKGGAGTIGAARYCVVEMSLVSLYDGSPLFDEIYDLMREMGFRLRGLGGRVLGPGDEIVQVDGIFEQVSSHAKRETSNE